MGLVGACSSVQRRVALVAARMHSSASAEQDTHALVMAVGRSQEERRPALPVTVTEALLDFSLCHGPHGPTQLLVITGLRARTPL